MLNGSNCIVDFSAGTLQNVGATVVNMDANSLLIVPAEFDPYTDFSSSSSLGLVYTVGTPLVVWPGQGFSGSASINDPVVCQGTIAAAPGGFINLNNGLTLSGSGIVSLGSGTLTVSDTASGIGGGSLSVNTQYVGNAAAGLFTQSGGTNAVAGSLYLGYSSGGSGDLQLQQLRAVVRSDRVGGLLRHGKLHAVRRHQRHRRQSLSRLQFRRQRRLQPQQRRAVVRLDRVGGLLRYGKVHPVRRHQRHRQHRLPRLQRRQRGPYNLNGPGKLSTRYDEYIGNSGTGIFTQSGGTNAIANIVYLGYNAGSSGAYNLSGPGLLSAPYVYVGYSGTGSFTQSGGANAFAMLDLGEYAGSKGPIPSAAPGGCRGSSSTWVTRVREASPRTAPPMPSRATSISLTTPPPAGRTALAARGNCRRPPKPSATPARDIHPVRRHQHPQLPHARRQLRQPRDL